jgi:hypothetical protein
MEKASPQALCLPLSAYSNAGEKRIRLTVSFLVVALVLYEQISCIQGKILKHSITPLPIAKPNACEVSGRYPTNQALSC